MSIFLLLDTVNQKACNELISSSSSFQPSPPSDVIVTMNGHVQDWNYYHYYDDNNNMDVPFLSDFPDNISHNHHYYCYHICPNNHTLLWKILQFSKMIIIKVGKKCFQSVSIITCLVWFISLIITLTIGIWIGRTWERSITIDLLQEEDTLRDERNKSITSHFWISPFHKLVDKEVDQPVRKSNLSSKESGNIFGDQATYVISLTYYYLIIQGNLMFRSMIHLIRHLTGKFITFPKYKRSQCNDNQIFSDTDTKQQQQRKQEQQEHPRKIFTSQSDNIESSNAKKSVNKLSSLDEIPSHEVQSPDFFNCQSNDISSVQLLIRNANEYCQMFQVDDKDEENDRVNLKCNTNRDTVCQSGITDHNLLPKHVAIIMDGNRRYGRIKYNNALRGHYDGCKKLIQVIKWCIAEKIPMLTVYALSTENWSRSTTEVNSLLLLIVHHCEEIRIDAIQRNVVIKILSTDPQYIPSPIQSVLQQLECDTQQNAIDNGGSILEVNICLLYSGRNEIIQSCQKLVNTVIENFNNNITQNQQKKIESITVTEDMFTQHLLTSSLSPSAFSESSSTSSTRAAFSTTAITKEHNYDPDILIRTSGEVRISNFLLYQLAYTEMFFLDKNWPEITKDDFISILQQYAHHRQRRFGT